MIITYLFKIVKKINVLKGLSLEGFHRAEK